MQPPVRLRTSGVEAMRLRLRRRGDRPLSREQAKPADVAADNQAAGQHSGSAVARVGHARGSHRKARRIWARTDSATQVPAQAEARTLAATQGAGRLAWPGSTAAPAKPAGPGHMSRSGAAHGGAKAAIRIATQPVGQTARAAAKPGI